MGKLIFYYGTMGCSKTANALMTRFQYIQRNRSVWLIKPAVDTRDDRINEDGTIIALVKSRVGIEAEAEVVESTTDIYASYINKLCKSLNDKPTNQHMQYKSPDTAFDVIICDEAQFLTELQVEQLKDIATFSKTDVLCYGLRTDFKTKLFSGSKRLFELADKVIELDNVCDCSQPAIVNAKVSSTGKILIHGSQIDIGGDEKYKAICWKCYNEALRDR